MEHTSSLLWQPKGLHPESFEFHIELDKHFAKKILEITLPTDTQKRINEIGKKITVATGQSTLHTPYTFYKNSGYVVQITADGARGTWLESSALPQQIAENSYLSSLKFTSHNCDSAQDVFALLALFETWIKYISVYS